MERLYEIDEVAEYLGLSREALAMMRFEGRGPAFVKISARRIVYRESDISAWVETRVRQSTNEDV